MSLPMVWKFPVLTATEIFSPKTPLATAKSFVFFETTFCLVYLGLLSLFGRLDTAPVGEHVLLGALLCAPFLSLNLILVSQHIRRSKKYIDLSRYDGLTKLPNRASFLREVERLQHDPRSDLIVLLDIDHFKKVNDTYGHHIGDKCLQEVAKFLKGWIEPDDYICRYGGEEFAILFRGRDENAARLVANLIAQGHHFDLGTVRLRVTFSIGITEWDRDMKLERSIKQADDALYTAKSQGRARAVWHGDQDAQSPAAA